MIAGALTISTGQYVSFVKEQLVSLSREAGVPLALRDVDGGYSWLKASELEAYFHTPSAIIPLKASEVFADLQLSSLFSAPAIVLTGELYGGKLHAENLFSYGGNWQSYDAEATNINAGAHPQLNVLGFVGGNLSFKVDNLLIENGRPTGGLIDFSLADLKKPEALEIPPWLSGLPLTLRIPAFTIELLKGKLTFAPGRVTLNEFLLESSVVKANTKQLIFEEQPNFRAGGSLNGIVEINLSDNGSEFIGPILPLLSQRKLSERTKRFAISWHGDPDKPAIHPR